MIRKRILLIPDAYTSNESGAVVARELMRLMKLMGCTVGVLSKDVTPGCNDDISLYSCPSFRSKFNYGPSQKIIKELFREVCDEFKPTHVFFVGSITNKPLSWIKEAKKRGYVVDVFIFMQDFFCCKFYANDLEGPCTKCLESGLNHVFKSECGIKNQLSKKQLIIRWDIRRRLKKMLPKVDFVITSTNEQIGFYESFGIEKSHCAIVPLPFSSDKLKGVNTRKGNYFIGIAQNRIEKGFHLIPKILKYASSDIKIVLAYSGLEAMNNAIQNYELQQFIDSGRLECIVKSWNDGLGTLIAESLGVINPTIWPTTTEFGLLETMALGKPIVAFDISAHHELLENEVDGFFSKIGDYGQFAENLQKLADLSDEEYDNMSKSIKKKYSELLDDSNMTSALNKVV